MQCILPLHLEWEPWYYSTQVIPIGTRVRVRLAGREYIAVVSSEPGTPNIDAKRVQPILGIEEKLSPILETELQFWSFIAHYYLCTRGDVYKMVYPSGKAQIEKSARINKKLNIRTQEQYSPSLLQDPQKPLLIWGWEREKEYEKRIEACLQAGRDVLWIGPRATQESFATQRELAKCLGGSTPVLVKGSRACLFLPFRKLGLVIVDQEHSPLYKRGQSPRFNARDAAVMLANLHGASVILGSGTPSLESLLNAKSRRYELLRLKETPAAPMEVVDTLAELKKYGMVGERSRILLRAMEEAEPKKYLEIKSWELQEALSGKIEKYKLIAVLCTEVLLSRDDFRADEKAWQLLEELRHRCRGRLIIQTKNASHPLLTGKADTDEWLALRKEFSLPPYTREVEIRSDAQSREAVQRFFLARNSSLAQEKLRILQSAPKNAIVDVDP